MREETREQAYGSGHEAFQRLRNVFAFTRPSTYTTNALYNQTTAGRRQQSTQGDSLDSDPCLSQEVLEQDIPRHEEAAEEKTVLYLAYGSNLSSAKFRGSRGIKPLSEINVYVPELKLTFDLPGLPYGEPCFAGSQFRDHPGSHEGSSKEDTDGSPLLAKREYNKDRWHKPLIGVVYEVTLTDYARIIATEGGGRGYRDMVVTCYPFPEKYNSTDPVPDLPKTQPFKAHTLLSPDREDSESNPLVRPDPSYAQPSARYLDLIRTGAAEHDLPISYQTYLSQIRPYRITTVRQRVGSGLFLTLWGPLIFLLITLGAYLADSDGRSPEWLVKVEDKVFVAMWKTYDHGFKQVFGDGERTIEDVIPR
ncbi:GliK protein [Paecilomyces variotii]|uniref:gamma-glutamylcyclotransferase n=1 Tax=Byssochlamys spectabilis TaxID=264951 RepID=A0A443I3S4_BYSSP|nr:GliK protein [Paecilomyces variotii]KAJ9363586.1 hypothetical protein DTO280E4_2568 [Paecilomyces variotii]RWQ98744.1 GliK protein [Paecilomyces variotii]